MTFKNSKSLSLVKYTVVSAIRDWFFIGIFASIVALFGVSILLGSASLAEEKETSLIYLVGGMRITIIMGMILFVCFQVRRSFDNKEIDFILSRQISRQAFIVSYMASFFVVAILIIIPAWLVTSLIFIKTINVSGALFWLLSMMLETGLILMFAIVASFILGGAVSAVMSCFAFYMITRLMSSFLVMIKVNNEHLFSLASFTDFERILQIFMKLISILVPRIDLFTQSEWMIYGVTGNCQTLLLVAAQFVVYFVLLIGMALHDFKKKQF